MPKYLGKHIESFPDSINFQVIAGRGKGKSTMVRQLLEMNNSADSGNKNLPEVGSSETTIKPTPYKFKNGVKNESQTVYLWDMPGLGGKQFYIKNSKKMTYYEGLEISNEKHWEDYLQKYGTGHFDRTFLICDANEGINEMELFFLRHLIHNKRSGWT